MSDCKHERYSRPDAYCPDCDVSWEMVERDQRIAELERQCDDSDRELQDSLAENQRLKQELCTLWDYDEHDMSVVLGGRE